MSQNNSSATILDRSVCLVLNRHYLGNYRKVKTSKVVDVTGGSFDTSTGHIDSSKLSTTKTLVDSKELTPAMRVLRDAVSYLSTRAIPAHNVFGDRTYLVPLALVGEVDAKLNAYQQALAEEAHALAGRYTEAVAKSAIALGPLFKASEYPTPQAVEDAFGLDWSYVSFNAPEKLEAVDSAAFQGAKRKYDEQIGAAYDEVKIVLRETLRQITAGVIDKLKPSSDGKPKIFRNSVLTDLTDFLGTFNLRNLADDGELEAVVAKLGWLTNGIDPQALREMDTLRESVRAELATTLDELDALVTTGRRAISFGDTLSMAS